MNKVGRNDPCTCGSGKKFKKCCEMQSTKTKKLHAEVISSGAQAASLGSKVASLFSRSAVPVVAKSNEVPVSAPQDS